MYTPTPSLTDTHGRTRLPSFIHSLALTVTLPLTFTFSFTIVVTLTNTQTHTCFPFYSHCALSHIYTLIRTYTLIHFALTLAVILTLILIFIFTLTQALALKYTRTRTHSRTQRDNRIHILPTILTNHNSFISFW